MTWKKGRWRKEEIYQNIPITEAEQRQQRQQIQHPTDFKGFMEDHQPSPKLRSHQAPLTPSFAKTKNLARHRQALDSANGTALNTIVRFWSSAHQSRPWIRKGCSAKEGFALRVEAASGEGEGDFEQGNLNRIFSKGKYLERGKRRRKRKKWKCYSQRA